MIHNSFLKCKRDAIADTALFHVKHLRPQYSFVTSTSIGCDIQRAA
jgi:hypothetical protein